MNWLRTAGSSITSLFFPLICPGCGNDLQSSDDQICISCFHRLPVTEFHRHTSNPVEKIFWGRVPIQSACSYLYFTSHSIVQHLMHELKYNGNREVGIFLGKQIGISFGETDRFNSIDAIIPLPLHPKREKQRGYNQAAAIAEGISGIIGVELMENVIIRNTETRTQTKKSRVERWENINGKFLVMDENRLKGKHVLLIDDVITTGATLEACAQELLVGTAGCVSIATLAYTLI
ncbi:MAG TPA: ComF family protein [Flavitalea sp.]|nr:ComF family protein [Flavitalea sp.]